MLNDWYIVAPNKELFQSQRTFGSFEGESPHGFLRALKTKLN